MTLHLTGVRPEALEGYLAAYAGATVIVGDPNAGGTARDAVGLLDRIPGLDVRALAALDPGFDGELGSLTIATAGSRRVVIVGLGRDPQPEALFAAALAASRAASGDAVSLLAAGADARTAGLLAQGHAAGAWRYRDEPDAALALVSPHALDAELARAGLLADVSGWVRRTIETPPNLLGPGAFAEAVRAMCARVAGDAVEVAVWDAAELARRGFGATLAVGAGGSEPPLAVELRVAGEGPATALAGKGITFDAGGTNLKRDASELAWMKSDLAAAACVAGAVAVAAALGTGPLHAVLPVAENLPGARAQRPGDVVTHPDGRTTEVVDTDCEGRLVLADALAHLAAENPARLVDVGTLTDSGAVGTAFWGCWSTSAPLAEELLAAGRTAADPGWRLPLHPGYATLLRSRVADIANAPSDEQDAGRHAATYLCSFVGEVPWVHVDNGSSAWLERDAWPWPEGPTDVPLRALVEWLAPRP